MSLLEILSMGITLLDVGKNLHEWVAGNTVSRKLDQISSKIERLDDQIYYLRTQEVWDTGISQQHTIEDLRQIRNVALPIQRVLGTELVISKPIVTPKALRKFLLDDPKEILFDIRPLRQGHSAHIDDPTLVPVTFSKSGEEFVGFIKIGYLKDFLNCDYKPQTNLIIPPKKKLVFDRKTKRLIAIDSDTYPSTQISNKETERPRKKLIFDKKTKRLIAIDSDDPRSNTPFGIPEG